MRERTNRQAKRISNGLLALAAVLMLAGLTLLIVPVAQQITEVHRDEASYAALREQVKPHLKEAQAASLPEPVLTADAMPIMPIHADSPKQEGEEEAKPTGKNTIDHAALQAQNSDYIAWLEIPGTPIDYPVVQTDDAEYYLHHTMDGKQSKLGTLLSLGSADYETPGRNIAIYGHHLRSGNQMFSRLVDYKEQAYEAQHDTIHLESLHHSASYRVFAVINLRVGEWEPATAGFADDEAFMAFAEEAKARSLYDTGVEVSATDRLLTLITCDRSYGGADGRLVVMAVEQASKEKEVKPHAEE